MSTKVFEYEPLPGVSIRLVQLTAGPLQHIVLQLGVFALRMAPPFTALSYTWGGEERSQPINIEGKSCHITPNLQSFLWEAKRRIEVSAATEARDRNNWNGGWLWIDSICIDQSNTEEKSVQVGMMKDIYESAGTIISWLRELDEDA